MRKMKLSDIKITPAFAETTPNGKKMEECRYNWRMYGKQDRYIVVNHNNVLVDGYIQYLILKEHREEECEVLDYKKKKHNKRYEKTQKLSSSYKNTPTTYIFGSHPNSNCTNEFCWRVPVNWGNWADNIEIGDTILCQTKYGFSPVVVNRVEILDKPPVEMRVKRVARKEIRRNGMVVEL